MKREKKVVAIVKFYRNGWSSKMWKKLHKQKQKHGNKKENINALLSFPGFC